MTSKGLGASHPPLLSYLRRALRAQTTAITLARSKRCGDASQNFAGSARAPAGVRARGALCGVRRRGHLVSHVGHQPRSPSALPQAAALLWRVLLPAALGSRGVSCQTCCQSCGS